MINPRADSVSPILNARGDHFPMRVNHPSHDAASMASAELASWRPNNNSADGEVSQERSILVARTQDMIRNHGLASGAVQTHLDNIVGTGLRLNCKPNWEVLKVKDKVVRAEWERQTEAQFNAWAYDLSHCVDASERLTFGGLMAQAYRSYLTSFEILATAEWLPERGDMTGYATAIQVVDPMRLSNPYAEINTETLRDGVVLGTMGEPTAYHISTEIGCNQYMLGSKLRSWKRIDRRTSWGRPLVMHYYDAINRPGLSRGNNVGIVSVLAKMKMLEKFEQASLQASILNAMYAAVIQSTMDWNSVGDALGGGTSPVQQYAGDRAQFHGASSNIRYNGVKIPHLYPGEEFKLLSPNHPNTAFAAFETAVLRYVAAGWNLTYEQFSRDYSQVNYSSMRAGMLEAWRFFQGKQQFIAAPFATDIYSLWLEEAFDRGDITPPPGAVDFYEERSAWCGSKWIGPGRNHIDAEKEGNAAKIEYSLGLTTLEIEAAARGLDWQELLEQRAQERDRMIELNLDPDQFQAAASAATPSGNAPAKPETGNDPATSGANDANTRKQQQQPATD